MPERPLECSQCKKSADVIYTEIISQTTTTTEMCRECPILKQKLEGNPALERKGKREETLYCNQCHTSLDAVLMGEPLGCKECYFIFQDILIKQLIETQSLSPRLKPNPAVPTPTLHIGKTPFIDESLENTTRIRDLNESLSQALKGENYEEAAWLRDQINSLNKAGNEQD